MDRKIIATDFDGTLNRGGVIEEETLAAIKRFRAEGGLFGVVTGRDRAGSYDSFAASKRFEFDFVLALNGAYAIDREGNTLFTAPIKSDTPVKNADNAPLLPMAIDDITEWTGHHVGLATVSGRFDFRAGDKEGKNGSSPYSAMNGLDEFLMLNTVGNSDEHVLKVIDKIKEKYGDIFNPLQNSICIDIPAVGVDKGKGVERYAELMNVRHENIWTAGDNYNDIAMIRPFHGCAVENGVDAVKEAAEYTVSSIAEVVRLAMSN